MAFTTVLAAALSGASVRRLRYWARSHGRRGPLLRPESRHALPALYSFRDLLALRMFVYLREDEDASLQRIRRALDTLTRLGDGRHPAGYRLAAAGRAILWVPEHGDPVDVVVAPGQQAWTFVREDVLGPFRDRRGQEVLALREPCEHVSVNPEVLGGYPVVKGTRVPYDAVAGLVRDGLPPAEVNGIYPGVSEPGARDATRFAVYVDRRLASRAA
ncbi:MAG: DUF433 domain-containing protein [Nitriliruptorales bacterium]|nr:DUF433 domain-containing protein [Nitriliruptorales bacterium]